MRAIDDTDKAVEEVTEPTEGAESEPAQATGEAPEEGQRAATEFGAHVRDVTQRIVDLMGLQLEARVAQADRHQVEIDLQGPDARIIIGKH